MRALKNSALLSVAASHFVVDFTAQLPILMFPILVVSMGLSYTQVGIAAALYTLMNSLVQPLAGYLGDRVGPRFVAATGVVFQAVFIGMAAFVRDFASLVFFLALAGTFSGVFHPVGAAVANQVAGRLKGTAVGTFFVGGNLGFALSPVFAARLFDRIGLHYAALMVIPAVLAATALAVSAPRSGDVRLRPGSTAPRPASPGIDLRTIVGAVTITFFRSYVYTGFNVYIPLFYKSQGLSAEAAGLALSLFLGGFAFGTLFGGFVADRIGRKPVIVATLALITPLALLFVSGPGSPLTLMAAAAAGLMTGGSFTPTIVLIQEQLPRSVGLATGIALGFTFASGAAGQALTGLVADGYGLGSALTLVALAPLLALPGGLLLTGSLRPRSLRSRPA